LSHPHHHDHQHADTHGEDAHDHSLRDHGETVLGRAFLLIAGFTGVEFIGGVIANSLTLIADAGHMLLDATALGLAWYAARLSRRRGDAQMSYGYHRLQVLAAFVNGLTLMALVAWILIEAVSRLQSPESMDPLPALVIASIGLVVNIVAWQLLHGDHHDINVRAAAMHVLGDLLGSAAAIIAALTVWFSGSTLADPLLAVIIALILARGAWRVLRESAHILLEGVPHDVDVREIRTALMTAVPGVLEVHHVHAWSLTAKKPLVTLHANVRDDTDVAGATASMKKILLDRFGIDHSTIQVELGPCPDRHP
jgi:cobalt-zinc-cadmium efflux system protein